MKVIVRDRSASKPGSENLGAYIRVINGASTMPRAVIRKRSEVTEENRRDAKAEPPSSSSRIDLTNCGTKTAFNAPPARRM